MSEHHLRALVRSIEILAGEGSPEEVLELVREAVGADWAFLETNQADPRLGLCRSTARVVGEPLSETPRQMVPWSRTPTAFSRLRNGEPHLVGEEDLEGQEAALAARLPWRSEATAPVLVGDRWAGVVGMASASRRAWTEEEVTLLQGVARLLGSTRARREERERLEGLLHSKDEFLATVSHELRTPLTAVVGLAGELRAGWEGFPEDEARELVGLIAEQSQDMAHLVEDLLVAARLEIGEVTVAPEGIELGAQARQVLGALGPEAEERIELAGGEAKAWADPVRVRQVLRNLVTNAFRYGGERITVETALEGGMARIRVRDDGPGVPEVERERIFDPYYRSGQGAARATSVGLGLFVSRRLARLMDGDLTYVRVGGESVFELVLPREREGR